MPNHMVGVIEDEACMREALAGLLSAANLNSSLFASAIEYFNAPSLTRPACLLVDLGIFEKSTPEFQARMAEKFNPPVIFITGRAEMRRSMRAFNLGAVGFLAKPFGKEEFFSAVYAAIARDAEVLMGYAESLRHDEG